MRRRGRPPKQRDETMATYTPPVAADALTYTPKTSPFVVEPPPAARIEALEEAALAAMNWYKNQALRPDDSLPVDYVCREIGKAIRAMQKAK